MEMVGMVEMTTPIFSGGGGRPSSATVDLAHYQALMTLLDAARTGNTTLIRLAVEHYDKECA